MLALGLLANLGSQVVPEGPLGGHRRNGLDRGGHINQERPEIARIGDIRQLLDEELRQRGAPEVHLQDSLRSCVLAAAGVLWNTRLARRSELAIVVRSSAVNCRSRSANRRLAWRRRARSSALRTLRALAKCGW